LLSILVAMVVIVGVAGLVIFYVAFPHRGEEPTSGGWLGEMMTKARRSVVTLDEEDGDAAVRRRPEDPQSPL